MTLDAHKHIGADKGISMAMGTRGTLSIGAGHVKVGAQPAGGELNRAMAGMRLVGMVSIRPLRQLRAEVLS